MTHFTLTYLQIFLCTLCLSLIVSTSAYARQGKLTPTVGIGWTSGGDQIYPIAREETSSGILNINDNITAGGEIHVWAGTIWVHSTSWETLLAVGYHNDAYTFKGGSANFGRIVYDIIPSYRLGPFRFGAGLTYHINVRHSLTDSLQTTNPQESKFRDVLGQTISVGYDFSKRGRIDLRYQFIDYSVINSNILPLNKTYSGNSVGLHFYVTF